MSVLVFLGQALIGSIGVALACIILGCTYMYGEKFSDYMDYEYIKRNKETYYEFSKWNKYEDLLKIIGTSFIFGTGIFLVFALLIILAQFSHILS